MMRVLLPILLALASLAVSPTARAEGPVVVELFTSQGCSNCPPADALLGELADRDDIIALALHVDYWDYIGWADTFADPAYSARQEGYARAAGSTVVYTPQIVVDGETHVVGHRPMAVIEAVLSHADRGDPVRLDVTREDEAVTVAARMAAAPPEGGLAIHLVAYRPGAQVEISRGENSGRTLDYHNIVVLWQVIGDWDGDGEWRASITPEGDLPHVLIVQEAGHGRILGAARLN